MIDVHAFLRIPIQYKNGVYLYTPSIKEAISFPWYEFCVQTLLATQEEVEDEITEAAQKTGAELPQQFPTPLKFLLLKAESNKQVEDVLKQGFTFFLHEKVSFLYDIDSILIGELEDEIMKAHSPEDFVLLNESNFFDFQNQLRLVVGKDKVDPPDENLHPRIKAMRAKARYRDRVKQKQGGGISMQTTLEAICCMGIGITPLNVGDISLPALNALMERSQLKEKYETDIRSLQAGAKPGKINPVYWIKNLE